MEFRVPNPRAVVAAANAEMDLSMKVSAVLAMLVLLAHWAFIVAYLAPRMGSVGFLRLHYTAAQGVDWIGPWQYLLVFPGIGLATYFVNVVVAVRAARQSRGLGGLVMGATVLLQAMLAAAGVLAVLLNG